MAQLFKPPVNYRNNDALPEGVYEGGIYALVIAKR